MRILLACLLAMAACFGIVVGISSCGDKVQSGLTGIDIQVTFESELPIRHLRFAGFVGHTPAFPRDDRPHAGDDRELDATDENLIVLLPDEMGEKSVFVRVDGLDEFGSILASSGEARLIERDKILAVRLHLGEPRICGDGVKHPTAEQCDDGNQIGEDGCSGECVVETDWTCEGQPSVCRTCGDGICSVGEDHCSCIEDCRGIASCGDGLCCPGQDENVCSCPDDCLEDGEATCPDGFCCTDEREAGNCMPDCGQCPNGSCETDKGEDPCTCPQDCTEGATAFCGNQDCCAAFGENIETCAQDCCPGTPVDGDGTCCPVENAENAPADCCATMPQCGDTECCPSEQGGGCPECCANTCGDGICCGAETTASCPQDCCPSCSDPITCPGCCADDCTSGDTCDLSCELGCSCYFECDGTDGCEVTCRNSACYVECTNTMPCIVTCLEDPIGLDGGVGGAVIPGMSACYCRGENCQLTCPPGQAIVPCGPDAWGCGPESCP